MNLDFTPFTRPITAAEKKVLKQSKALKTNPAAIAVLAIFGGLIVIFVITSMFEPNGGLSAPVGLSILGVVALIGGVITFSNQYFKRRLMRMMLFAQTNHLRSAFMHLDPAYPGTIFEQGYSRKITTSYLFPNGIEVGNYTYMTGSGRSRATHYWGYIRVKLVRRLPHMILDAKKNNSLGISSFPGLLGGARQLNLEGNFNDYFKLYVPPGYETDALYVFTPDVMAALIDHGSGYDIEVVDDWLIFANDKQIALHTEKGVSDAIKVAQEITTPTQG
jgi:hypothetical protein